MKKEFRRNIILGSSLLLAFVIWTVLVCIIDVKSVGPEESEVGFSTVNMVFHSLTGVNMSLYVVTDLLGLIPVVFVLGFAVLGFVQLCVRKSFLKVDKDIIALGVYYIAVFFVFLFFEIFIINYRPVLLEGKLEASYPSSTTMLSISVMLSVIIQLKLRLNNFKIRICAVAVISVFTVFMVVGRLISGVHWLSDIIGGVFLSLGLAAIYYAAVCKCSDN